MSLSQIQQETMMQIYKRNKGVLQLGKLSEDNILFGHQHCHRVWTCVGVEKKTGQCKIGYRISSRSNRRDFRRLIRKT